MSMGCISGTQLLLMDGQDRMSNQVAGTQRMVEHVVEYKRRSGELTSTRRLADCLPPQDRDNSRATTSLRNHNLEAFTSLLYVEEST